VERHPCHCYGMAAVPARAGARQALWQRLQHCETGRRFTYSCTPYGPASAAPSSPSENITTLRRPSTLELPLFGYKIGHDGRIAARVVRTAAHSTA
jgi:predicted dienelactone hydrolase